MNYHKNIRFDDTWSVEFFQIISLIVGDLTVTR